MKKAIFFDPYIDTVGGGERYVFTLIEHLLKEKWRVDLLWDSPTIVKKLESRFGLKLQGINFINFPGNIFSKYSLMKKYDIAFWLSDGSVPFMFSKKNILHFQVPFHGVGGGRRVNKLKLQNIQSVVCNSLFTKRFIDKEFGIKSEVIYPPVEIDEYKPGIKEKIILYVGRYSQLLQSKRQDVLIGAFRKMIDQGLKNWKLVLAGAIDIGGDDYFNRLKILAKDYPIELMSNTDFDSMKRLYGKATIFWNASGYDIDEEKNPEKVEHFGMTTVEAMSAGVAPVVIGKGGQAEIVTNGENGYLWYTEADLVEKTLRLIKEKPLCDKIGERAILRSKDFSKLEFCRKMEIIINK